MMMRWMLGAGVGRSLLPGERTSPDAAPCAQLSDLSARASMSAMQETGAIRWVRLRRASHTEGSHLPNKAVSW